MIRPNHMAASIDGKGWFWVQLVEATVRLFANEKLLPVVKSFFFATQNYHTSPFSVILLMRIHFPQELPVVARKEAIREAIANNPVVIVAGDTGSGKTTQIPKICLELYPDSELLIGCTQPRRIAASSVSSRVSEELGKFGNIVGYKIRFHDYTSDITRIKFMTDGVLLAETRNDPLLKRYKVIVLDEAHERSLNIDFLLGYLKKILPRRPDLKLIVTSATIDTAAFSKHFNDAPVVQVSGRTYPVTVRYQPPETDNEGEDDSYVERCAEAIVSIYSSQPPGDILAFLPTEKDIRACCALVAKKAQDAVVLPMFGRLQSADQRRIFQSYSATKIVIATNVAETSITVPGIRYVVDSGLARMSFYNARAKTTSLPIHRISKASCDQRKGRCGRIGPGICVRLYSEEDYNNRDEFTAPEITRANLAEVILQMVSLQLGRPDQFPFIDPPHKNAIRDGYKLLQELGAISPDNTLTPAGRFMSELPVDPCISRILLEAKNEDCLHEVKIIASALAIQDPRIRPAEKENEADAAHRQFAHKHSDFMTLLNIWNHFQEDQELGRSWSRLKKYCTTHFLSFQRMREWVDLHEQLSDLLQRRKDFSDNRQQGSYEQIHKSLACGFLRNIAVKKQPKIYQGAANRELMIFPGSHQFLTAGQWIIAASFIETNRLYALTVATIESDWLEPLAPHLVKYSWSNPRWNKKTGQVVADEKVTLFGLIIVTGRLVNFPKRDPKNVAEARTIFIQAALIEGNLSGQYPFLEHNQQLIDTWRKAEDRLRTTAIVHDDSTLFAFYENRLPDEVCDKTSLNKWLKKRGHKRLMMSEEDIVRNRPDDNVLSDFPSQLYINSFEFQLDYNFSPGSESDGVTVRIPLSLAPTLQPAAFEWLVPGLLRQKILFLIKGLPKSLRRHLVPANLTVDRLMDDIDLYNGSLYSALSGSVHKMFRIHIQRSDWPAELPTHLQARFVLFDLSGKEVAAGRDLHQLIQSSEDITDNKARSAIMDDNTSALLARWENFSSRTWAFDDLQTPIPIRTPQQDVAGFLYPVLVAQPDKGGVGVTFVSDQKQAEQDNIVGTSCLFRLQFGDGYKALKKYCESMLSGPSALFLLQGGLTRRQVVDQMITFVIRALFPAVNGTIPSRELFFAQVAAMQQKGFYQEGRRIVEEAVSVLKLRKEVQEKLNHFQRLDGRKLVFTADMVTLFQEQLNSIVSRDFFISAKVVDLETALRQLQCLIIRLERFYANPAKDQEKMKLLQPHLETLLQLEKRKPQMTDEAKALLAEYQLLIGEYRISIFSPELKTRMPVSAIKLQQQRQLVLSRC
ncbi:ATP-dependent RNA helicase HrpA [Desulfopila aestuarii]|nr:ATP-dependent RNA helicase HrpA [Desulfopila aestuarii]